MTRRICCVCNVQYGQVEDGRDEVVDSHGYCERCAYEELLKMESYFPELPAEGLRSL